MVEKIGICKWKNRSQCQICTLQDEKINLNLDDIGQMQAQIFDGRVFIFDLEDEFSSSKHHKISNIRILRNEKREDVLIKCFAGSTLENFEVAIDAVFDTKIQKHICSAFPDLDPNTLAKEAKKVNTLDRDLCFPQQYEDLLSIIKQFQNHHNSITWDASYSKTHLEPSDIALAKAWLPDEYEDYDLAKMLSARIAEKVAKEFYKNHFRPVKDVSIMQLKDNTEDWMKYDIQVGKNVFIDVKNARSPVNNKNRYVEFCVPRFKLDRYGNDITIAGVFSPYLFLDQFHSNLSISEETNPIYFLGEINNSKIEALENRFNSQNFHVEICGKRKTEGRMVSIIPPWTFDYPCVFYLEQKMAKEKVKNINQAGYPSEEECEIGKINPLPAFIASKIQIPKKWSSITLAQRQFVQFLFDHTNDEITLPDLYLSILADFLNRVNDESTSSDEFTPGFYDHLIYFTDSHKHPLGIMDPLNIINDLLHDLGVLWNRRHEIPWSSFITFKFKGLGLLTGHTIDNRTITLLAYCGGWIKGKGKCGHSPLIFGQNKTCEKCGKLICNQCGYCSDMCLQGDEQSIDESAEYSDQMDDLNEFM